MIETAHTPGPWVVEDRRNAALKNIRIVSGSHEIGEVSDVHQRDYQGSFNGDHKAADALDAIGLANARLIAASPDLLALAKAYEQWEADLIVCHEAWEGGRALPEFTQSLWDRLLELQTMRNLAVKKATKSEAAPCPAKS
jgi:hypothetical protein